MSKKEELNRGVIFDMDGVIINSNPYHKIAWTNFLSRKNVVVDDSVFKELIFGTTGVEAISELLNGDYSKKELDDFSNEIDAEYRDIIRNSKNIEPVDGLLQFIQSISNEGYKIALATSAPPENVDLILRKFQILDYFDLIVDKNQVVEGKPNPEVYQKAVQGLGLPKENCIVFEDSFSGIVSARDAGLMVVGVTTSHANSELIKVGATLCINDFSEITLEDIKRLING